MKSPRHNALRRATFGIEGLETRRLLSAVNPNADTIMDNDGVPDLRITGDTPNDMLSNIDVYIDFQNTRTIVHDDINGIGTVEAGELYVYDTLFETIDIVTLTGVDSARVFFVNDFGCRDLIEAQAVTPVGLNSTKPMNMNAPTAGGLAAPTALPYTGQRYFDPAMSIYADMGTGNDTFWVGTRTSGSTPDDPTTGTNESVPFDPDGANICCADLVIEATGGDNDDKIEYDFRRTSIYGSLVTLNADGTNHNDTINVLLPDYFHGVPPLQDSEVFLSERISSGICDGSGTDDGAGGAGADQLIGETPTFLDINIETGTGNNTVNLTALTTVVENGSIVDIDIEGNSGVDNVNALMGIALLNQSIMVAPTAGTALFPNSAVLDGAPSQFFLDVVLGGGNDRFQANWKLELDHFFLSDSTLLHVGVAGGDGTDTMRVDNTSPGGAIALIYGTLEFDFKGGNHDDYLQVQLDSPVAQANSVQFFNYCGGVKAYLNGDGGNDYIEFDEQVAGSPLLDVMVMGGAGNDRLVLAVNVELEPRLPVLTANVIIAGPRYPAPRNAMLIDGGTGTDQWDEDGNFTQFTTRGVEQENDALEESDPQVTEIVVFTSTSTGLKPVSAVAQKRVQRM